VVVAAARRMYAEEHAEREPGEVLLAAVSDVDAIVQKIKQQVQRREELSGTDLLALGEWLDRAAKLAKTALDAGVQERQVRLAEAQGRLVAQVIREVLRALGHNPHDPGVVRIVSTQLRALGSGATA
jgi:hypothetical protein